MTKTPAVTVAKRPLSALDAIYGRRSVRSYAPHMLAKSSVRALLDAAVQAPTAMLVPPEVFVVVQDRQVMRQLSDRVKATWAQEAQPDPKLHIRRTAKLHGDFLEQLANPDFNAFHDAGTLILICARRTDPSVVADCWLAAENLMLAACALRLGTCCIAAAVPALNAPDTRILLGMPADVTAVVPIIVGVPAGGPAEVTRHEPEIISWK